MKKNKFRLTAAFTLIEMLLVVALLSTVSLAVYNALANGIRVWEYSRRFSAEEDVAIFLEKLSADLQNTYAYSLVAFDGKPDKLTIPTIVQATVKEGKNKDLNTVRQMGAVQYYWEADKKQISRRQGVYGQAVKQKFSESRTLAKSIGKLRFSYILYEKGKPRVEPAIKGRIPAAVLVEFEFAEVTGKSRPVKRLINIPISDERKPF